MTRWTDHHHLTNSAKRLIFGTENPSKGAIALYTVGQFKTRVITPGEEETRPVAEKLPALPGPGR